ncbi:MAG TPA: SEL1-like repeat protein [Nitrospira sp.]|nr:SEL1-like repeat protein [Nitrospira sp.]
MNRMLYILSLTSQRCRGAPAGGKPEGHRGGILLGQLYWEGRGITIDRLEAYRFSLAAAHGHPRAAIQRDMVAMEMGRDQVIEAQRLALEQHRMR